MRRLFSFCLALCLGILTLPQRSAADVGDKPPDYPAPGSAIPGPFHVLNVTGPKVGSREGRYHSLVVRYGLNPVVAVFVRPQSSDANLEEWMKNLDEGQPLATLLKKVDAVKVNNPDALVGAFAVYTADTNPEEEQLKNKLKTLPEKLGLEYMVQAVADDVRQQGGMKDWKIQGDGDKWPEVAVVLYTRHKVVNSWTFGKDKALTDKDADVIAAELDKLIPSAQRPGQSATLKVKPKDPEPKEAVKEKEPKEKDPKEKEDKEK